MAYRFCVRTGLWFALLLLAAIGLVVPLHAVPEIRHARGFRVVSLDGGILVTVKPRWQGAVSEARYLLVPRGKVVPSNHPQAQVIFVPVKRVVALSTTHLAYIDAAGQVEKLVGLSDMKYVNTPSVRRRIEAGDLREVGQATCLRIEPLLQLSPDLILTTASGSIHDVHPKLQEAGLPTVLVLDHLEDHPLARLEWIKFLALFLDTLPHANRLFDEIAGRYHSLAQKTAGLSLRPTVFTGVPFQGQWWVPRGDSFIASYIRDAGGHYIWTDIAGVGSVPMDVEAVYARVMEADVWLHTGTWQRQQEALASDPRFATIRALRQNRLYNNNKRLNRWGGNDFWESGMLHSDVVLADLIAILHPELLPAHTLVYHQPLSNDH